MYDVHRSYHVTKPPSLLALPSMPGVTSLTSILFQTYCPYFMSSPDYLRPATIHICHLPMVDGEGHVAASSASSGLTSGADKPFD